MHSLFIAFTYFTTGLVCFVLGIITCEMLNSVGRK